MILSTTYKLGNVVFESPIKDFYAQERGTKSCTLNEYDECNGGDIWPGNSASWTGSIALMYPSDVGLSTESSAWNKMSYDKDALSTSWLSPTAITGWSLSPDSIYSTDLIIWMHYNPFYKFTLKHSEDQAPVFPALCLKSTVQITGGQGTSSSPYTLS